MQVENIRVIALRLSSSHVLELRDTIYVFSMRMNLILVVTLDQCEYNCHFGNGKDIFIILFWFILVVCVMII